MQTGGWHELNHESSKIQIRNSADTGCPVLMCRPQNRPCSKNFTQVTPLIPPRLFYTKGNYIELFLKRRGPMDQQKPDTIYVQPAQAANGLAVAAFVLGIIGLVLFFIPVIPYPLAILAIIFGGIAATKHVKKGFAITGIVTGIVTLAIKLAFWLGLATLF